MSKEKNNKINNQPENGTAAPKKKGLFGFSKENQEEKPLEKTTVSSRTVRLINEESNFMVKEAYKMLRTNIIFTLPEEDSSVILVTSSWPLEGKTTNCANLAVVFSQMGEKTLLIDADLRKPRIHKLFKLTSKTGLSNVLRNLCSVEEATQKTAYENLDVITSGHIPPNPAELLASDEMKALLAELKGKYKYILIDTPPVNMVSDAIILAPVVSGMVLVVRQDVTVHKSVTESLEKIHFTGTKILGFILNDSVENKSGYYSKRKYSYKRNNYYSGYYYGYYGRPASSASVSKDDKTK